MIYNCKVCGKQVHLSKDESTVLELEKQICFFCSKNKSINLWLDDLRPAPAGFIWVKNIYDCIIEISCHKVNVLSLDHDLGDDKVAGTGYDFVKWLVEKGYDNSELYPNQIYLHTANPVGRQNMYQLLNRYKPDPVKLHNGPMSNYLNPKIDY